jgi:hypothetical protein
MIKYVYMIDYPAGERSEYLAWVRSIAHTLQAPEEVQRLVAYENYFSVTPHRFVEFEFDDMASAARYFDREEIKVTLKALFTKSVNTRIHVLTPLGDYSKT